MAAANCITAQAREDRAIYRALRILESRMKTGGDAMTGTDAVRDYLRLRLAGEEREVFAVVFLNSSHRVIETEILFQGTLNQAQVYPREVARRALYHNAASILLAHNHPSGLADPSRADLEMTRVLIDTLALVDVRVLDHFIIGSDGAVSLQEIGLFGEVDFPAAETKKPSSRRRKKSGNTDPAEQLAQV